MERVTIREASVRLRLSASEVRQCIQNGELKAYRQTGPEGRLAWVVELPEDGWVSAAMAVELERPFSPWWWTERDMTGSVHYVEVLTTSVWEEVLPRFLCGISSDSFWLAEDLSQEAYCPHCLEEAKIRNLPLT
jgi:excisionase family DNA binding protein